MSAYGNDTTSPTAQDVACRIIDFLTDSGPALGGPTRGGVRWRPAGVTLARELHPGEDIQTRSNHGCEGYLRYFHVMHALSILEDAGLVAIERDATSGEFTRISVI